MKFSLKNMYKTSWVLLSALAMLFMVSCGDDEEPMTSDNPIASFQFEIDETNFLQVTFTNFSQNANSYSWDFGDDNTSTEDNPTHTYEEGGTYTVTLTASNGTESAERSETITITDPNTALKLLTGETSKTWKLFREGTSMSLGPNADEPALWWSGLQNDGSRPCLYEQEITFGFDGSYTFNDNGMFWAEFGIFNNVEGCDMNTDEQCFEATAANMVNACGDDVSAWLSGTHQFDYDPSTGSLTLTGMGAWIGIPKLGSTGETITPTSTVNTRISIEEFTGYDVMLVEFVYDGAYWPIRYASYSDANLEPALETEAEEFGEDLPDVSPSSLENTFMEAGTASLDTIFSGSTAEYGVADPADAGATCGQFNRTDAQFQELKFQTSPETNDINFENLTTVSIDVYMPSSNDYSGALENKVIIGFADQSKTEQWWTDQMEYITADPLPLDEWVTISYNLADMPTYVAMPDKAMTVYERNDYDMIYVQIGGGNHMETGTFYVRNFRFE